MYFMIFVIVYYHYYHLFFKKKFWLFGVSKKNRHDINEGVDVHDLKTSYEKWNFVKLAKPLIGFSILILIVGIVILSIFKLRLGIDFSTYALNDERQNCLK